MAHRMPDASSVPGTLSRLAARLRPHHFAAVAAMAIVLAGVAGVRALAVPRLQPIPDGERLKIQVVAPVEPPVTPGGVMEVGDLVNGFEGVPPASPSVEYVDYAPWEDEAVAPEPRPAPKRYAGAEDRDLPPRSEAAPRDWRDSRAARWFGFDAPDRDYRAEREARRARMEARMERDREAREPVPREVRRYRSDGEPREVRRYYPDGRPYDGETGEGPLREDEGALDRLD